MRTLNIVFLLGILALHYPTSAQSIFSAKASTIPLTATTVEWGDFDIDGDQDALVVNSSQLFVYVNNLSGTNSTFVNSSISFSVGASVAHWIDINNDGYLDIFAKSAGGPRFLISKGGVTFSTITPTFDQLITDISDWGDVDKDGDLDLLAGGIFENKGNYKFELRANVNGSKLIDFDGDGDLDVFASERVYSNLGGFVFTLYKYFYQDLENQGVAGIANYGSTTADIDGDGKIEFLGIADFQRGYPTFQCEENFLINSVTSQGPSGSWNPFDGCNSLQLLSAADFDNDGSIDLVTWNSGIPFIPSPPSLELYSKNAEGVFAFKSSLPLPDYGQCTAVDFNNDGKLDLAFGARLFINGVSVAAQAPSAPQSLAHTITGDASVSFSWSLGADDTTPAKSLTYNLMVTRGHEPFFNEQVSADFKTVVTGRGNVGHRLQYALSGLPNGIYQWSVQSVDQGMKTSAFTEPLTFEIKTNYDPVATTSLTDNFKTAFNETSNQYLTVHLEGGHVIGEFIDGRTMQPAGKQVVINPVNGSANDFNVGYNKTANKYFVVWTAGSKLYGNTVTPSNITSLGTETLLYTMATPPDDVVLAGENIPFNSAEGKNGVFWIERRAYRLDIKFLNLSFSTTLQAGSVVNVVTDTNTLEDIAPPDFVVVEEFVTGSDVQYIPRYKSYALAWSVSGGARVLCGTCFGHSYMQVGYRIETIDKDGVRINSQKVFDGATFDPKLQYNPYNNTLFASWKLLGVEITNGGRDSYEISDVLARRFDLSKSGVVSNLTPVVSVIDRSNPGTPNLFAANPHISWTPKRNEFVLSFDTSEGVMYFQRIDPFEGNFLEPYQTTVTPEGGSFPKLFADPTSGEFLLGWTDSNEGHFKKFNIRKDPAPIIASIKPTSAYPGDTVLIMGSNFGRMPFINKVKFGSIDAHIDTVHFQTTMVRVVVPPGLSRQPVPITLTFDDQSATSATMFENLTLQSVTKIDITTGERGNIVTITGDRFPSDPTQFIVKVGDKAAKLTDIVSSSTSEIKVKIPEDALRGTWPVAVVIQGQEVAAPQPLRVIVPPVITSVTASEGFISCNTVTINGKEFSDTDLKIKFGAVPATEISLATPSLILVKVPFGAEGLAPITIETDNRIASSDPVNVQLGSTISPTSPAPPTSITLSNRTDDGVDVQVRILNNCSVQSTKLWTKGISESNASWKNIPLTLDGNRADARLTEAQFSDPIGLNVMFEIEDKSLKKIHSDTFFIRKNYTELDSTNNVPGLAFGGGASDYNIISIPYQLSPNNIPSVFKDLVNKFGSDSSKWRLFHYLNTGSNAHYIENTRGLDKIEPGKGYWMIVRYPQEIFIDGAQAVDLTNGPFEITLQPGWNQVGNPYNFAISWADVLSFNKNPANLESLKVFADGGFQQGSTLGAFRGGFVKYNGTTPLVLKIPYTKNSSGRQGQVTRSSVLTDHQWYVPLTLSGSTLTNETLGIGMDPNAQTGFDAMDESRMPAFFNQLDVAFDGNLASSVVPTDGQFTWKFIVHNATSDSKLSFSWNNTSFGDSDRNLYLYDVANERVIDMRTTDTYSFSYPASKEFKVLYGDQAYIDEKLVPEQVLLGEAYPNPMTSATRTNIPFTVVENDTHVKLTIYNINGQPVATLHDQKLSQGFYEIGWDGNDTSGRSVSAGMYIYRLESSTKNKVVTQSRKLVSY